VIIMYSFITQQVKTPIQRQAMFPETAGCYYSSIARQALIPTIERQIHRCLDLFYPRSNGNQLAEAEFGEQRIHLDPLVTAFV
jgi:hypothetical protein